MSYSITDDLRPESFYSEMTEEVFDISPGLTLAEQYQIFKDVDELYKTTNNN